MYTYIYDMYVAMSMTANHCHLSTIIVYVKIRPERLCEF